MTKFLFILLFLTMGCEVPVTLGIISYYNTKMTKNIIVETIEDKTAQSIDKKKIIIPNNKLESKKWAKFIVGSMHYYGDGRERDEKLAKSYLKSFLEESNPDAYSWQYLEAQRMLDSKPYKPDRNYQTTSLDGSVRIFVGESSVQYEESIYGVILPLEVIEINTPSSITIFNNLELSDNIYYNSLKGVGWIDNDNFIIHASTSTYTNTYILNVRSMNFNLIANGSGAITNYPGMGRVLRLDNQKRYLQGMYNPPKDIMGAFWIDALYDFEGNLLKILSYEPDISDGTCYLIKDLIDIKQHQFLIQNPNECIYVYK